MAVFPIDITIGGNPVAPNYGTFQIMSTACAPAFKLDGAYLQTIQLTSQTNSFRLYVDFNALNCDDDIVIKATVVDSNGCNGTQTFTVANPCKNMALDIINIKQANGTTLIQSVVNGGVAPYTYLYSGNNEGYTLSDPTLPNQIFPDGVSATLKLTVTDSNGCVQEKNFTVIPNVPVTINNYTRQLYCSGSQTFQINFATLISGNTSVTGFTLPTVTKGVVTTINSSTMQYVPNGGATTGVDVFPVTVNTLHGPKICNVTVIHTPCIALIVAEDDIIAIQCSSSAVNIDVLDNDTFVLGELQSAIIVDSPLLGTAVWDDFNYIVYTPNFGVSGEDRFTYMLTDLYGQTTVGEIIVIIEDCVAPELSPYEDIFTCSIRKDIDISLLATYAGIEYLELVVVTPPAHGTINVNGLTITWSPSSPVDTTIEVYVYDNRSNPPIVSNTISLTLVSDCCNDPVTMTFGCSTSTVLMLLTDRTYRAYKNGTYKDGTIIDTDVIEYSIDSASWVAGETLGVCDVFNSYVTFEEQCSLSVSAQGYSHQLTVLARQCGLVEESLLNVEWFREDGISITTTDFVAVPNTTNYQAKFSILTADFVAAQSIRAHIQCVMDDGSIQTRDIVFNTPDVNDPAYPNKCTGVTDNTVLVAIQGTQKDVKWRRKLTYTNGCDPWIINYDIDVVDVPYDGVPCFINGTKL